MALDPIVRRSFQQWSSTILAEAVQLYITKCRAIDHEAAATNRFQSGWRLSEIDKCAAAVFRDHAAQLLEACHVSNKSTPEGGEAAAADELATLLEEQLVELHRQLGVNRVAILKRAGESVGMIKDWASMLPEFEMASSLTIPSLIAQARIAAMTEKRQRAKPLVQHHTYNAPVGAVQTGSHATATVHQTVTLVDSVAVAKAIEQLGNGLRLSSLSDGDQRQALEVLSGLEAQTKLEAPNKLLVSGLLGSLSSVVSMMADASPAWETLQSWWAVISQTPS